MKVILGITDCHLSVHALTGGFITCVNHINALLVKGFPQTKFTWQNYPLAWETDHIWACKHVDRMKIWHRFKVMNWINLQPLVPVENGSKDRGDYPKRLLDGKYIKPTRK